MELNLKIKHMEKQIIEEDIQQVCKHNRPCAMNMVFSYISGNGIQKTVALNIWRKINEL